MFHQIYHHDPLQIYQVKKIELFYDTKTERIKIVKDSHVVLFQVDSEEIHDKIRYTIRSSIQISNKEKSLSINDCQTSVKRIRIPISFRFLLPRLTPAYLFVLGINEIAIKYALSRTVFSPVIVDHLTCEKFWWRNALYLNSLYPRTEMVRILDQHFYHLEN